MSGLRERLQEMIRQAVQARNAASATTVPVPSATTSTYFSPDGPPDITYHETTTYINTNVEGTSFTPPDRVMEVDVDRLYVLVGTLGGLLCLAVLAGIFLLLLYCEMIEIPDCVKCSKSCCGTEEEEEDFSSFRRRRRSSKNFEMKRPVPQRDERAASAPGIDLLTGAGFDESSGEEAGASGSDVKIEMDRLEVTDEHFEEAESVLPDQLPPEDRAGFMAWLNSHLTPGSPYEVAARQLIEGAAVASSVRVIDAVVTGGNMYRQYRLAKEQMSAL